jgi:hypothetical protein
MEPITPARGQSPGFEIVDDQCSISGSISLPPSPTPLPNTTQGHVRLSPKSSMSPILREPETSAKDKPETKRTFSVRATTTPPASPQKKKARLGSAKAAIAGALAATKRIFPMRILSTPPSSPRKPGNGKSNDGEAEASHTPPGSPEMKNTQRETVKSSIAVALAEHSHNAPKGLLRFFGKATPDEYAEQVRRATAEQIEFRAEREDEHREISQQKTAKNHFSHPPNPCV